MRHPDLFVYQDDFLSQERHRALLDFLHHVEDNPAADSIRLTAPVIDGSPIEGRLEGRAGWPVYSSGGPVEGVPVPGILKRLAEDARWALVTAGVRAVDGSEPSSLTSVYVDRYPQGGSFFPHTDRDIYGEFIVGVSLGGGSCRLTFESAEAEVGFDVRPGSLYAFGGWLRRPPVTHRVSDVTGERYAVTFRSPAGGLRP